MRPGPVTTEVVLRERTARWLGEAFARLGIAMSVSAQRPMLESARVGLMANLERY